MINYNKILKKNYVKIDRPKTNSQLDIIEFKNHRPDYNL